MKKMLVFILALSIITIIHNESFAEKNTFVDFVTIIIIKLSMNSLRIGNMVLMVNMHIIDALGVEVSKLIHSLLLKN